MKKLTFAVATALIATSATGAFASNENSATPNDIFNWRELAKIEPASGNVEFSSVYGLGGDGEIYAEERMPNTGSTAAHALSDFSVFRD